jgi:uncharacterized protein (DUF1330 family)
VTAYLVVQREGPIRDPAEFAEYQRMTREIKGGVKLTPLVVYGGIEALEGDPPDAVVMLAFETGADAMAWYMSPAYQAALLHRLKAADYRSFIVEGLPSNS